jgi:predicted permease
MSYTDVLNIILPTFITILIGFVFGKIIKINLSGVIDVIFYVGLPALVISSISNQHIVMIEAAKVWGSEMIVTIGCGLVAWLLFKALREKHSGLYLPISLPNTVNIPFPIIALAYGATGLFFATLYYIPNIILIYSLGIFIAAGKSWRQNMREMLRVPVIYAAVVALALNFGRVTIPPLILRPLDFIAGMVTPTVVLTLGYSLASVKITHLRTTVIASIIRLGIGLTLGVLAVWLFHLTGVAGAVVILISAMPAAINTYTVAAKYQNEPELVASVVFVTTVASLLVIPFLLRTLGQD